MGMKLNLFMTGAAGVEHKKNKASAEEQADFISNLVQEHRKVNYEDFYMTFNEKEDTDKKAVSSWNRIADMVIGPEHEYVYLKRIIARYKFQYILNKYEENKKMNETYKKDNLEKAQGKIKYLSLVRLVNQTTKKRSTLYSKGDNQPTPKNEKIMRNRHTYTGERISQGVLSS